MTVSLAIGLEHWVQKVNVEEQRVLYDLSAMFPITIYPSIYVLIMASIENMK